MFLVIPLLFLYLALPANAEADEFLEQETAVAHACEDSAMLSQRTSGPKFSIDSHNQATATSPYAAQPSSDVPIVELQERAASQGRRVDDLPTWARLAPVIPEDPLNDVGPVPVQDEPATWEGPQLGKGPYSNWLSSTSGDAKVKGISNNTTNTTMNVTGNVTTNVTGNVTSTNASKIVTVARKTKDAAGAKLVDVEDAKDEKEVAAGTLYRPAWDKTSKPKTGTIASVNSSVVSPNTSVAAHSNITDSVAKTDVHPASVNGTGVNSTRSSARNKWEPAPAQGHVGFVHESDHLATVSPK